MQGENQLAQLIEWWNLPFTLPFALALIYLVLTASGMVDTGQAEDGADGADGADHADGTHDADDADGADAPEPSGGSGARLLGLLGVGRVPLAIVIQVFFLVWGFAGWAATTLLRPLIGEPLVFFWPALLIAAVCATFATSALARPLARWLPSTESHAPTKHELAGKIGTVVFPVTAEAGTVHVRDERGNVHQIACRLEPDHDGAHPGGGVVPKEAEVIVVSYDDSTGRYFVVPSDLPALPKR